MSPRHAFEALRALDRRALAVQGDLATRLEHEVRVAAVGLSGTIRIPEGDEMARLEIELTAIAGELVAIANEHGIATPTLADVSVSRSDAVAAYDALRRHTAEVRAAVAAVLDAFLARHAELRSELVAADGELDEPPVGGWRRALGPKGITLVVLPVVLALMYAAWRSDRDDRIAAATKICERPPPCEGDVPELAWVATRSRMRHTNHAFVLYRAASDCRGAVEVYFGADGSYEFRGSPDDPDPEARRAFLERRARWLDGREELDRVACTDVDDLF